LDGFGETSLGETLSPRPDMNAVIDELINAFGNQFGYKMLVNPL
jgi:hypothetical protein